MLYFAATVSDVRTIARDVDIIPSLFRRKFLLEGLKRSERAVRVGAENINNKPPDGLNGWAKTGKALIVLPAVDS